MYTGNCPFIKIADNLFRCPQCGYEINRRVKRNCHKTPQGIERTRNQIYSRLQEKADLTLMVYDQKEIDRKLSICFGGCSYFGKNNICTRWGGSCCAFEEWMVRFTKPQGCSFWRPVEQPCVKNNVSI